MSNLLKYNSFVVNKDNKMVIDSNRMIEELLEEQERRKNFAVKSKTPDEDGFICGLDAATVEELINDDGGQAQEEKSIDIEDVKAEAQKIIDDAMTEAEQLKQKAKDAGYQAGLDAAKADSDKMLSDRMESLEAEYNARKRELEEEYEAMRKSLEPELAETILEVFSKVVNVMAEDKKDMILSLVNGVLNNEDMCREFLIHVSDEDYSYLEKNKELLYGASAPEIQIDICRDSKLSRNQCIIESDAGVFDCSLDIQLENLKNDIRLLSCINK